MKFLLYEIIPRAGFNLATGRFRPAGRMFDTPGLNVIKRYESCRMLSAVQFN